MSTLYGRMFNEEPGEADRPRTVLTPEAQRAYLAHVNGTCPGCEACEPDWSGPTKAEVAAQVRAETKAEADARRKAEIQAWRQRNPEATCSDAVAGMLADLEATCRPTK